MSETANFVSNADFKLGCIYLGLKYLVLLKESLLCRKYIHLLFCKWKDDQRDTYTQVFLKLYAVNGILLYSSELKCCLSSNGILRNIL